MKVSIDQTVEVSDVQRREIASIIDGRVGRKRDATRAEMKEFIWEAGAGWETVLSPDEDVEEDLIGELVEDEDLI